MPPNPGTWREISKNLASADEGAKRLDRETPDREALTTDLAGVGSAGLVGALSVLQATDMKAIPAKNADPVPR
jgi:hypothetical protein